jgi:Putative Flp pilus-assembly TadE/G-like
LKTSTFAVMLVVGRAASNLGTLRRGEQGQTLIIFVLAMPLIISIIALVADGSSAFANKRRAQNAADATALAVARDLPSNGIACTGPCLTTLQADAQEYSDRNGGTATIHACDDSTGKDWNCYVTPYNGPSSVQIRIKRTISTFFAGSLGLFDTSATATAAVGLGGTPSAAGNVSPLGLSSALWSPSLLTSNTDCATVVADCYTLNFDASGFALFDLSNTSTTAPLPSNPNCNRNPGSAPTGGLGMNRDIAFGYPGDGSTVLLPSNAWYCGNNGGKNGLKNGMDYAYDHDIILMVPVFDPSKTVTVGQNTSYWIIGFSAFSIDQPPPNWTNNTHYLQGHFTTFIATGISGGPPGGPNDFGVHVITLDE